MHSISLPWHHYRTNDYFADPENRLDTFINNKWWLSTGDETENILLVYFVDRDNSGGITFGDFMDFLSSLSKGSEEEKILWSFRFYDINKDGIISRDEMIKVCDSIISHQSQLQHTKSLCPFCFCWKGNSIDDFYFSIFSLVLI